MLTRNAAMSAAHTALEMRPEPFDGVRMRLAVHPLFATMIHRSMAVAHLAKVPVAGRFISAHVAALRDVLADDRQQRVVLGIGDDVGHQIAATLHHAEHRDLVVTRTGATNGGAVVLAP